MKPVIIVTVAIALFYAGRRTHPTHAAQTIDSRAVASAAAPSGALEAAPGSSAARRAAMQTLLVRLTRAPAPARANPIIERSVTEPPEVTTKRRLRASAEIDERAPGLAAAKRAVLLEEADRLAWDKRQLRAAFLAGKLSEADYVAALEDDIRAALASFEETLTEDEYIALFNRRPGSDPFTMESLVGKPAEPR